MPTTSKDVVRVDDFKARSILSLLGQHGVKHQQVCSTLLLRKGRFSVTTQSDTVFCLVRCVPMIAHTSTILLDLIRTS